jgi:membrane-associated phospholipid phosphatase
LTCYIEPEYKRREEYSLSVDGMKIAIIAFTVILLGVVFKDAVYELEIQLMVYVRENYQTPNLEYFCTLLVFTADLQFIQICLVALYLYSDPHLAFKCTFLILIQMFFVTALKVFSTIPRPYWVHSGMNVTICALDYSGPSDHICVGALFYTYVILIYYYKYSERRSLLKVGILLIATLFYIILVALSLFYLGQTFLFECLAGMIYSILIAITYLKLDRIIHRY